MARATSAERAHARGALRRPGRRRGRGHARPARRAAHPMKLSGRIRRLLDARADPPAQVGQEGRVDRVRHGRLAVGHVGAGFNQPIPRLAAELDADHRVVDAMADRHRQAGHVAKLESLHLGDEAAEGDQPGEPRATGTEAQRVGHRGALREAAEDGALRRDAVLGEQAVEPAAGERIGRVEGLGVGGADLPDHVPVRAARRQRQGPARRRAEQPPVRIELVEQREQVVLVGAAAVEAEPGRPRDRLRPVGVAGLNSLCEQLP